MTAPARRPPSARREGVASRGEEHRQHRQATAREQVPQNSVAVIHFELDGLAEVGGSLEAGPQEGGGDLLAVDVRWVDGPEVSQVQVIAAERWSDQRGRSEHHPGLHDGNLGLRYEVGPGEVVDDQAVRPGGGRVPRVGALVPAEERPGQGEAIDVRRSQDPAPRGERLCTTGGRGIDTIQPADPCPCEGAETVVSEEGDGDVVSGMHLNSERAWLARSQIPGGGEQCGSDARATVARCNVENETVSHGMPAAVDDRRRSHDRAAIVGHQGAPARSPAVGPVSLMEAAQGGIRSPGGIEEGCELSAIGVSVRADPRSHRDIVRHLHGLLMICLGLLLAGCGSTTPPAVGLPGSGSSDGGVLVIGLPQEPRSFLAADIVDRLPLSIAVDAPVTEGLLWYRSIDETVHARSPADHYRPDLATEVPTVENGDVRTAGCRAVTAGVAESVPPLCVTWKLRSGVLWHDGSSFSSRDVCDTFRFFWLRYRDRNPTAIASTAGWDQAVGCAEEGPSQATLSYASSHAPYLSLGSGVYGILPGRLLERPFAGDTDLERTPQTVDLSRGTGSSAAFKGTATLDRMIDGTGPFVFHAYEPTRRIVLVRNPRYWDARHRPHLDAIVFTFVGDVSSQVDQAASGAIDMGLDYGLPLLPRLDDLSRSGRLRVETLAEQSRPPNRVIVNSYSSRLRGLSRNDVAWTFNSFDWFCEDSVCRA